MELLKGIGGVLIIGLGIYFFNDSKHRKIYLIIYLFSLLAIFALKFFFPEMLKNFGEQHFDDLINIKNQIRDNLKKERANFYLNSRYNTRDLW